MITPKRMIATIRETVRACMDLTRIRRKVFVHLGAGEHRGILRHYRSLLASFNRVCNPIQQFLDTAHMLLASFSIISLALHQFGLLSKQKKQNQQQKYYWRETRDGIDRGVMQFSKER